MKNRAVTLGQCLLYIRENNNILNPAAFSIQAWLKFKDVTGTQTLIRKGTQFKLIMNANKLQINVGSITKEIIGYRVPVDTFFHISIVESTTTSYSVYINGKYIQDLNENILASPIVWNVYVDRSQLKWENANVEVNKAVNEEYAGKLVLVNTGATAQNFEISNIPSWIKLGQTSGTVKALSNLEINYTIDKGLNVGSYDENLYLKSDAEQALALRVNVMSEVPNWTVNEGKYTNSMNIISILNISDVVSTDVNDKVAVFINGECVGVAQPAYYTEIGKYLLFMKVYGEETMSNSALSFKVYDASSGKIFAGKTATPIVFVENDLKGTPSAPISITAKNDMYQVTQLNAGWTWISFPLANTELNNVNSALSGMMARSGDIIKDNARGFFDSYSSASRSWIGTLSNNNGCNNTSMYLLKSSESQLLSVSGTMIDASTVKLSINGAKWNYISYLPMQNIAVKEALAGYTASANDVLKSQNAFAVYDSNLGWIGDLKYMEPGKGYMLYRAASTNVQFSYPTVVGTKKEFVAPELYSNLQPGLYAENMSLIAKVKANFTLNENDWIVGFAGNEVRSANTLNESLFASIQGDMNSKIAFAIVRNGEIIATSTDSVEYSSNSVAGSLNFPVELNFKRVSDVEGFKINVYPNPVADVLTIETRNIASVQSNNAEINISVCDLLGKTVLYKSNPVSASSSVVTSLNMSSLKAGLYLVKVVIDGKVFVEKITKN